MFHEPINQILNRDASTPARCRILCTLVSLVIGVFAVIPEGVSQTSEEYYRARTVLRLLTYDRNIRERTRDRAVIAIVTSGDSLPENLKQLRDTLETGRLNFKIPERAIAIRTVAFTPEDFEGKMEEVQPAALFLSENLEASSLERIIDWTRANSVLSIGPRRIMVTEFGVSVGLVKSEKGGSKPHRFLVNLDGLRAEGIDIPARVLDIADECFSSKRGSASNCP